jgi:hypothetical protein
MHKCIKCGKEAVRAESYFIYSRMERSTMANLKAQPSSVFAANVSSRFSRNV